MKLQKPKQMKKIGNQQQTAGGQRLMRQAAVVLAVSLALGAGQVSAAGKGKGPRASVLSETECELQLGASSANLVIETTLTNKSSGDVMSELRDGSKIDGTFKKKSVRGKVSFDLDASPEYIVPQPVGLMDQVSASFDLCAEEHNVSEARELNGRATMMYGIDGGDGETREVVNRCSDNPDTEEDEGGIKVTNATFNAIATACGW